MTPRARRRSGPPASHGQRWTVGETPTGGESLTAVGSATCGPDRPCIALVPTLSSSSVVKHARELGDALLGAGAAARGGGAPCSGLGLGGKCPPLDGAGDIAAS